MWGAPGGLPEPPLPRGALEARAGAGGGRSGGGAGMAASVVALVAPEAGRRRARRGARVLALRAPGAPADAGLGGGGGAAGAGEAPAAALERAAEEAFSRAEVFGGGEGAEGGAGAPALFVHEGAAYAFVRPGEGGGDVWAGAAVAFDAPAPALLEGLRQLLAALEELVARPLSQDAVRQRLPSVMAILSEAFPYGRPEVLAPQALRDLLGDALEPPIQTPAAALATKALGLLRDGRDRIAGGDRAGAGGAEPPPRTTLEVTGAVPWRRAGLQHKRNELYLDVIEQVDVLVGAGGEVLSGGVQGHVKMRAQLSGMPECKIGLNEKVMMDTELQAGALEGGHSSPALKAGSNQVALDHLRFHQCVRLASFETSREISFIPPEGEFELMSYNVASGFEQPFRVTSQYTPKGRSRADITVTIKGNFVHTLTAYQVIVWVPLPKNAAKVEMSATGGKTKSKYVELQNHRTRWKISEFEGGRQYKFQASISLLPTTAESTRPWEKPPLRLQFQIPMYTSTGLRIRFLKITERSGYQATKWVRYLSQAGNYELRMG